MPHPQRSARCANNICIWTRTDTVSTYSFFSLSPSSLFLRQECGLLIFCALCGYESKALLVHAGSTLAESAGRSPARDCSDLAALFVAAPVRGHRGQSLRGHSRVSRSSSNFLHGLALVPIGVYLSKRQVRGEQLIWTDSFSRSLVRPW